jgi:hypothetical protein
MSYCYDVMARAWETMRLQLPAETRDSALALDFTMLIQEMHEANHKLKDAINHDERVTSVARRIDHGRPNRDS